MIIAEEEIVEHW